MTMQLRLVFVLLALYSFAPATLAQAPDERPAGPGEWGFHPAPGEEVKCTPPSFSWRPQKGAVSYELEASRDGAVEHRAEGVTWNVHRPARAFAPGEWSWRFRAVAKDGDPGAWSTARAFVVPPDAAEFALPPRDELLARIPDAHPRLFLRPEDLDGLRTQARGPLRAEFEKLVQLCEKLVANPPPTAEPERYPKGMQRGSDPWRKLWWGNRTYTIRLLDGAATLAFAWRLGGREEFGELARTLLLAAAKWDPKGATGYRYNDEAGMPYAYHFSRTYTFVHPLLTEEERATCRDVMRVRGRQMYAHLCPRHLWKPYSSHSNRAWHFLGEVGIAFHGELPEADDWIWFAANVFANVYPVWSDATGGWHEGIGYWASYLGRFTWWADVQRTAFGLDAYRLPFFASAGNFALYTMPPGTRGGGFGDLNAKKTAKHNRSLMTVLAAQARNPHWQWYVDALGGSDWGGGYVGFLRRARQPPTDLPTSYCFRGTGQAVLNATLESATDNVEILFKSSPFGTQSHGYESQNAFLLYAFGERLLIRSGYRDSYGSTHHKEWMWDTKSVNSILVNGAGQTRHSAAAVGELMAFHTEPGLHYVEGEAAAAYGGRLESFRRGILFLEPDLIVIHDRLRAAEPSTFEWLLHAPVPFVDDGVGAFVVQNGKAACRIDFLLPHELRYRQTDRFDPPPRERIRLVEHHLTATAVEKRRDMQFLTIRRPFRSKDESPHRPPAPTPKASSGVLGPRVFPLRPLPPPRPDDAHSRHVPALRFRRYLRSAGSGGTRIRYHGPELLRAPRALAAELRRLPQGVALHHRLRRDADRDRRVPAGRRR